MVGPPPPPPGPPAPPCAPPPPVFSPPSGKSKGGGGDPRSALLQSIQKGAKLKKTVTVDKSGPALSGKIIGAGGGSSNNTSLNAGRSSPPGNSNNSINQNGMPKLGGIFGGMSSMPKLKPVGSRGVSDRSPTNESNNVQSPPETTTTQQNLNFQSSSSSNNNLNGKTSPLDFGSELAKTLTLKRQKQQNLQIQNNDNNLVTSKPNPNRGPPPQPPVQKNISSSTSDTILGKSNLSSNNIPLSVVTGIEPNNSSLFKKSRNNSSSTSSISTITNGGLSLTASSSSSISSLSSALSISNQQLAANKSLFNSRNEINDSGAQITTKPVPNHGKPNLAPKPPGVQLIANNSNNGRPTVSRHHSMKNPRSPPVAPPGNIVFPSTNHFGTMRGPPQLQMSEANPTTNGIRPIGRPTVAPPPRPPPTKPPPPPQRTVSHSNLTNIPPPPETINNSTLFANSTQSITTSNNFGSMKSLQDQEINRNLTGSVNNVNQNNINGKLNSNGNVAPPLPPHRICPPPPVSRPAIPGNNNAPPVPPARGSSMRINAAGPTVINQNNSNITTNVSRLIIDLEAKFSNKFHNVTEFPKPQRFTNVAKTYPSQQAVKSVNEVRKPKAPSPPKPTNNYVPSENKS